MALLRFVPQTNLEEGKSEQSPAREEIPEQKQSSTATANQTSETNFSPKHHFPEGDGEGDQSIQTLLANIDEVMYTYLFYDSGYFRWYYSI